jgi:hypothetical protein
MSNSPVTCRTVSGGWFLLLIAALGMVVGCDQDPLGTSRRTILGDYQLKLWEDGSTYLLVDGSKSGTGWEVAGGSIIRVGWDQRRILVERHSTSIGGVDGFIVVDVAARTVSGPLSSSELAKNVDLAKIKLMPPAEAWKLLGR